MSLGFLYPLFWLGAVGIAAPLWLHLRRRQQTDVQPFSTLRFLSDQPIQSLFANPLRLRDLALLALRLAGLLLLVAAFAWPYLPDRPTQAVVAESRVYIFDNTLSRQAGDGFAKDRDGLIDEIRGAAEHVQLAVVELSSVPRTIAGFGDGREAALAAARDLKPTHQRGSYLAAFRLAGSLLANAIGPERTIVLLGDSQENQWQEGLHSPPILPGVRVQLPRVAEPAAPNLSVFEPQLRRVFLGDKVVVECLVKLFHQGPARSAAVAIRANGRTVLSENLDLVDQPEIVTMFAQWAADPAAWIEGEISVKGSPDALAADDRVFFVQPPVREGKLWLLARSRYLQTALGPEVMRGRWSTRLLNAESVPADTADAHVLCVESHFLETPAVRNLVLRFLNDGKGVLLSIDQAGLLVRGFLRDLGIEPVGETRLPAPAPFRFIFFEHPVFHPFRTPDFGNLLEVRLGRYRQLKGTEALPLVFAATGDPVILQSTRSRGRLFVTAFSFERSETSWPVHPTFVPFLDLCLQNAREVEEGSTSFGPRETYALEPPAELQWSEAVLRSGTSEVGRAAVVDGRAELVLPDEPGIYALGSTRGDEPLAKITVAPPAEESRLTYTPAPEALAAWIAPEPEPPATASALAADVRLGSDEILRQRLWWLALVAALAALVAETCWLMRKERQ